MYIFHKCEPLDEKSYSEKIPLDQKEDYIKKYKLKDLGIVRDYWIQNVFIQSHKHKLSFTYINDISLHYNQGYLCQELSMKECSPFNFFNTDLEEEYHLYGRETDTYKIYVKVFKDYMTNEIWSTSKDILNEL